MQRNAGAITTSVKGQPSTAHSLECNQSAHPLRTRSAFTCFSSLSPILHPRHSRFQLMTSIGQIATGVPSAVGRAGKGRRRRLQHRHSLTNLPRFAPVPQLSHGQLERWGGAGLPRVEEQSNSIRKQQQWQKRGWQRQRSGSSAVYGRRLWHRQLTGSRCGWLARLAGIHPHSFCCIALQRPGLQQQVCLELWKGSYQAYLRLQLVACAS